MSPAATLAAGVEALHLTLDPGVCGKLLEYLALIDKWNRVYNLTAVRAPEQMVTQHLLDSLAVAPHLRGSSLLDVGSGAGLPGIPLAVAAPRTQVTLLEANQKKSAFLQQAKLELKLDNVAVVCERVEAWRPGRTFEMVISRAFSDLAEFVNLAGRHAAPGGRLAAMKGIYPHEELAQLPAGWALASAVPLNVPGLRARRHLLLLERQ